MWIINKYKNAPKHQNQTATTWEKKQRTADTEQAAYKERRN